MKCVPLKVLCLFILLFSCKEEIILENPDGAVLVREKSPELRDFIETKYPNIFIHKKLKISDKKLNNFKDVMETRSDFIEHKYSSSIRLSTKDKHRKTTTKNIYITERNQLYSYAHLQVTDSNLCILDGLALDFSSQIQSKQFKFLLTKIKSFLEPESESSPPLEFEIAYQEAFLLIQEYLSEFKTPLDAKLLKCLEIEFKHHPLLSQLFFCLKLSVENKNAKYIDDFRSKYGIIEQFSSKIINQMTFEESLLESYENFLYLLCEETKSSTVITNIDELIDLPKSDLGLDLIKVPNEHELMFFLKKVNRLHSKISLAEAEKYLVNYLHFRHLLTSVRIAKTYQKFNPQMYGYLRNELKHFLEEPLKEISTTSFKCKMVTFFNPLDFFVEKIKNFWIFEHEISAYFLDSYPYEYLACFVCPDFSKPDLGNHELTHRRTPLIYLSFSPVESLDMMFKFIISHEIGHHLQDCNSFYRSRTKDPYSKKIENIASELEADMYAGFYAFHQKGLNLGIKEVIEIGDFVCKNYGDSPSDFDNDIGDLHGTGEQRKRAYMFGVYLAGEPKYRVVNQETKVRLHEKFEKIYIETDYFKDLSSRPIFKKFCP